MVGKHAVFLETRGFNHGVVHHLVNYYGYLKWGNTYYLHRDWTIKQLLGDEQYQKLVETKYPTEIVKIEWHKVVHDILTEFD